MKKAGRIYLEIANEAMTKWYPEMSEKTRQKLLGESDYEFLENNYVFGHDSISEGVIGLRAALKARAISLPRGFTDYVKYGGNFDAGPLREEVAELSGYEQAQVELAALSAIHDRWVRGNVQKFFDPGRYSKRYMFMPIALIGFNEVESDLIFLRAILKEIGMRYDWTELHDAYLAEVVQFRYDNKASSRNGLINWLMFHYLEYEAADKSIAQVLHNRYEAAVDVADQVIIKLQGDGFGFLMK